jgi:hypothetical protein
MTTKSLKHKFHSGVADGTDTSLVRPSDWNNDHDFYIGINAQTGTSYTVADGDAWSEVSFNNAAAVTVTLPQAGASSQFLSGWRARFRNLNEGAVTIAPQTSTINGLGSLVLLRGDHAVVHSDGTNYFAAVTAPRGDNLLINGGFDVWQRGTSFASGAAAYGPDRWKLVRDSAVAGLTVSRLAADAQSGATYKLRLQRDNGNAGTNAMWLYTALESADSVKAAGRTVVLSYYAKAGASWSPSGGALQSRVTTGTGTDQAADGIQQGSTWTGQVDDVQTDTITATRTRFAHVLAVPATATQIGVAFRAVPVGTAGANDFVDIDSAKLEIGNLPTPFISRPIQVETALCQRYYYRRNSTGASNKIGVAQAYSASAAFGLSLQLPATLRVAATPSPSSQGALSAFISSAAGANAFTSLTFDSNKDAIVTADMTGASGLSAGNATVIIFNGSSGYIEVSAEV